MSQPHKLKIDRILEISEAVELIGENRYLEGTTAYKIGILGDYCKPFVKAFTKQRDKIVQETRKRQRTISEPVRGQGTTDAKMRANEEISTLVEDMNDKLNELTAAEEDIKIPVLKLSEFIAKADITDVFVKDSVSDTKVVVKAGNTLVPTKFFTLMGDIIIDDKNVTG